MLNTAPILHRFGSLFAANPKSLTGAQQYILSLLAEPPKRDYRAPHANRATPPRKHYPRVGRKRRLFKGHRI